MAVIPYLLLLLSLTRYSRAAYCLCKDGVGDAALQKAIDFSCGNGADCGPILQTGACYSPNTVKDHCNYAVNSYYQRKSGEGATCDFSGAATPSSSPPSNAASGCTYPSSSASAITSTTSPSTFTPPSSTNSTTSLSPPTYQGLGPSGFVSGSSSLQWNNGNSAIITVGIWCFFVAFSR